MRKADYALLAQLIKKYREHYDSSPITGPRCETTIVALESLAHEFASSASVDKQAFLKACGIYP